MAAEPLILAQPSAFAGGAADWIAAAAAVSLLGLLIAYRRRSAGHEARRYDPGLAWLCAGAYFCAALLLSRALGVLPSLLAAPLITQAQWRDPYWIAGTLFYAAVLWVAYMHVWPRGTFTDGRRRHPWLTTGYGLAWGLCHGQVFLCFWALAEWRGLGGFWVPALTFALLSGYNFAFHQFFWDVRVSPPHNYAAWNLRKVLCCHTPNLLLGLVWLALWGNFGLWLLLQTGCLLASAHHMRFPAWYDDYSAAAGETR